MQGPVNIAIRAARAAGNVILRHADRLDTLDVEAKSRNDFVSEVDRQAEAVIIDTIQRSFPDHGILAEESGARKGGEWTWVIDPLDGTTNYLHGFPQYAVSIALEHKGRIEHGVIYDPARNELFAGSRGEGATLDDRRIRVSKRQGLEGALLGTGFPFRQTQVGDFDGYLRMLAAMMRRTAGIRRAGSAALDLAWVAAGRMDGFWELGLKEWDMAAGALLIRESGGIVSDLSGGEGFLESGEILTANPRVYREMLSEIGRRPQRPGPTSARPSAPSAST